MNGEIGLKIKKVSFSKDMPRPVGEYSKTCIDMTLLSDKNECIHVCGDNDWGYLMVDAFLPLTNEENRIKRELMGKLARYDGIPEVIGLGENDYRAMDIVHRLSNNGEAITEFNGIPVTKIRNNNGIKLFGTLKDAELPF